jgi:hypothetical protein
MRPGSNHHRPRVDGPDEVNQVRRSPCRASDEFFKKHWVNCHEEGYLGDPMENKFIRAVIAGIVAGIVKDLPNLVLFNYSRFTMIALWEYAGAIALGRLPQSIPEHCYAVLLELLFGVFLGLFFVNIPFLCQDDHDKLRGVFFGALVWFIIRAAVLAFQIRVLLDENLGTSVINLLESMLFGYVFVCSGKFLERRVSA